MTYRAPALPAPVVEGPQTAVVVGPANEEIYTDNLGRIKIQFHWDRLGASDEHSSCWVRVSQSLAGPNWGAVFLPRIGHEVVVSFLEGDPDQPLVTGSVYNGLHLPPYPLPEHKTKTVIRTQTHKEDGYNEISFEDEVNQEEVFFHAQKNLRTTVINDRYGEIGQDEECRVGNHQIYEILGDQKEIIGGQKTSVTEQTFTEDVAKDVVLTYNANAFSDIAKNQTRKIFGHQKGEVSKDDRLEVGQNYTTTIHASRNISIGANDEHNVGNNLTLSVGKNVTVKSDGQTTIISADEIKLLTGSSGIILKNDGKIQLSGISLTLDGSDKVNVLGGIVKMNPGKAKAMHHDAILSVTNLTQFQKETHQLESLYAIEHLQGLTKVFDNEKFAMWLSGVFGYNIPPEAYLSLFEDLKQGAFENPPIEVTVGNIAFYDNLKQTIFVGKELVQGAIESQDQQNKGKILAVLVHEFGHHIDYMLRNVYSNVGGDAMLDEGAAFAAILGNFNIRKQSSTVIAHYSGALGTHSISLQYSTLHAALKEQRSYIENDKKSQNGDREYFSAGGTAEQARQGKYGHQSIELELTEFFSEKERLTVYYGNWLRDYSQVVDPKVLELNLDLLIQQAIDAELGLDSIRKNLSGYLSTLAQATETLKITAQKGLNAAQAYTQQLSDGLSDFTDEASSRLSVYSDTLKQQSVMLEQKRTDIETTKDNLSADGVRSRMNIEHAIESNRQHQAVIESMQNQLAVAENQQRSASQFAQSGFAASSHTVDRLETQAFFAEQEKYIPAAQESIQEIQTNLEAAIKETQKIADQEIRDSSGITGGGDRIGSKGISRETLTQIVEILARKEFPELFAEEDNSPYRLTPEKLGVYLPKEHLDNPKGVTAPVNPEYAQIFRGNYQAEEGKIDPNKWYKNYFKQSIDYAKHQLSLATGLGRTPEGLIHFGQALHVMEDIYAHSNFVELAINRILNELPDLTEDERRHVNDWVKAVPVSPTEQTIQNIRPLTTGVFGASDTLVSLLSVIEKTKDHSQSVEEAHFQTQLSIVLILMQDYAPNTVEMIYDAFGLEYSTEDERKTAEQILADAKKLDELSYDFRENYNAVMEAMFGFINRLIALLARQTMEAMKNAQDDSSPTDPTHTQLAKDPDDHPLHTIAAEASREMVQAFGKAMRDVWRGSDSIDTLLSLVDDFFVHPEHISSNSPAHIQNVYQVIARWTASNPTRLNQARHYWGHQQHEYIKLKELAGLGGTQLKFTTDLMKKVNP
ncbi:type VI secretion system tip protein TssI/VgrG [Photobacterium halotolerans]|uniref:type VI secretion system tip protein TssI/VgrG n=1 Tax=Photobacterium halotolerans TaxID=265726 RepID=UPI0004011C77|nr:type VI secretion system tip protein TssI/VgrG [Photobacterium halotolerans]